jgi:MtN3 and saliva related transmembrane protein
LDRVLDSERRKMKFLYVLQIVGGCIMIVGYVPQVRQIVRTRSVRDLNIKLFIMLSVGLVFMEVYAVGLVVHDNAGGAFLITNTLALAVNIFVAVLIAYYSKPGRAVEREGVEEAAGADSAG